MKSASRTLVKSPPEVWEQLDHPGRMQGLMSALIGHAAEVDVYERDEESRLCWRAVPDGARIEVDVTEKGWGTNVSVKVENGGEPTKLEGWLDAVLEELATPQKRPFEGMTDTPAETVAEAVTTKPEPVEAAEQASEPKVEEPARPEPAPQPEGPRKKRRFFIF